MIDPESMLPKSRSESDNGLAISSTAFSGRSTA
jgi:hypothetical protein